jgi:hypothetical protein
MTDKGIEMPETPAPGVRADADSPQSQPRRSLRGIFASDQWPAFFVWAVWAGVLVLLLTLVATSAGNVPLWDEWQMVPTLVQPGFPPLSWLWLPWADHRLPMTRLLHLVLFKATGDFRAAMFVNVLAIGVLSFAMIRIAGKIRGRISYTDAFFPLLLLHPGHEDNYFQGWNIQNVAFACLAGGVLLLMAAPGTIRPRRLMLAGLLILLLPLNGAAGVGMLPALAVWLGYCGWCLRNGSPPWSRAKGLLVICLAVADLLMIPLYFWGFGTYRTWPKLETGLIGSWMFVTAGLGPAAKSFWPLSSAVLLLLALIAICALAGNWASSIETRLRGFGFVCMLAGMACVALGVGFGRAVYSPDLPLHSRYALLSCLTLSCLYFASMWSPAVNRGRFLQLVLFFLFIPCFVYDGVAGISWAREHRANVKRFEREVLAGVPALALAARHDWMAPRWNKELPVDAAFLRYMENDLVSLRQAGIGIFRYVKDTPPTDVQPLEVKPSEHHEMTWREGIGHGDGSGSSLEFRLDRPRRVYMIYLQFTLHHVDKSGGSANFQIAWPKLDEAVPTMVDKFDVDTGKGVREVWAWVDGTIDRFDIYPDDKPFQIAINKVVLIIPQPSQK